MIRKMWGVFLVVLLLGCSPQPPQGPGKQVPAFERVSAEDLPNFEDDLDAESLKKAIEQSIVFYNRIPADRVYMLGDLQVRAETLKASLLHFQKLLETGSLNRTTIAEAFDLYRSRSEESTGLSLVTGYYEPILQGRLEPDRDFCYPLYSIPPDLVTVELASFDSEKFAGERLVGRLKENRVLPYYTRGEIDGQKKLDPFGCQMAWLKDPVDIFFLHVQGSGMIQLSDGSYVRVGYAGANGRPYRSIGKYLLQRGVMSSDEISMQSIRDYLKAHPEERDDILWYNESYVFFRWVQEGPVGSLNVPLTAGRSIATDPRYHPRGALAFLETEKPRLDANGQVLGWEPLQRWVLNQDVGGAIKGIGRTDLFCGSGETAEWTAGRLKHPGKLYFLLMKEESSK